MATFNQKLGLRFVLTDILRDFNKFSRCVGAIGLQKYWRIILRRFNVDSHGDFAGLVHRRDFLQLLVDFPEVNGIDSKKFLRVGIPLRPAFVGVNPDINISHGSSRLTFAAADPACVAEGFAALAVESAEPQSMVLGDGQRVKNFCICSFVENPIHVQLLIVAYQLFVIRQEAPILAMVLLCKDGGGYNQCSR